MAQDWETVLREWGHAPGLAEQTKMENTESQIKAAINANTALSAHNIQVAAQGSYKNLTHIPRESDVDIRVVLKDSVFLDFTFVDPNATTEAMFARFGISPATYSFETFRDHVGAALVARFGPPPAETPGDKAFGIRETRYFVDADVVAALGHRRYHPDGTYDEGVEFRTRKGKYIINWPDQQFRNGIIKNQNTGERFKAMVRALKNLRVEMADQGKAAAKPISSFFVECLVWNVPNDRFNHTAYHDDMKEILRFLYLNTTSDAACADWREESALKYLFHLTQPWTREQANAFVLAAWNHVGFTG
jgi:hypothetical protein